LGHLTVDIQHAAETDNLPADDLFTAWAQTAWLEDRDSEVTVRIVGSAESAELNGQYRNKSGPTNVLSFPFEAPAGITVPLAGDLIICEPVVEQEAREQHKTPTGHWAHMVVHGMLHLQGYDHIEENEAEAMEALEIQLLSRLGFGNPYDTPYYTGETEQDA